VRRRQGSVCSIALLLVCLELKSDSLSYRTQLHSTPKLQHYHRYAFLEGQIDTATLRWAVFACIPGGASRPYRFLLWKLSFARAIALAPEKIDNFLARLNCGISWRFGHLGRALGRRLRRLR
jgi:hypothetical protein